MAPKRMRTAAMTIKTTTAGETWGVLIVELKRLCQWTGNMVRWRKWYSRHDELSWVMIPLVLGTCGLYEQNERTAGKEGGFEYEGSCNVHEEGLVGQGGKKTHTGAYSQDSTDETTSGVAEEMVRERVRETVKSGNVLERQGFLRPILQILARLVMMVSNEKRGWDASALPGFCKCKGGKEKRGSAHCPWSAKWNDYEWISAVQGNTNSQNEHQQSANTR